MKTIFSLEENIMKTRHVIIPAAIILFSACLKDPIPEEIVEPSEEQTTPTEVVYTFTIEASKGESDTKALDLVNDGSRLNVYWRNTEKVKVYKGGTLLGTLDVTPSDGEKTTHATIGGNITTTSGLAENDELTLLIPRDIWDYTGQNGQLTGENSIEEKYAYATAIVNVTGISGNAVSTTYAHFANVESIYRFGFKLNDNYIDPKSFTVSAAGGKLVQTMSWVGSEWTPAYGSISVTSPSAPADHFFYVSIRNDQTTDDTFNFVITGSDDALYMATKDIPGRLLEAPGKFNSAKSIIVTQPSFAPASGAINDSGNVL